VNSGQEATLLNDIHTSTQASNMSISVAPGKGSTPLGLITDKNFEELCLPCIYAGQTCPQGPLTYRMRCRWELRIRDQRAARSPSNIFMKLKKLQAYSVRRTSWTRMRKTKHEGKSLTAGDLLDTNRREEIMRTNIGWTDLKQLRGSPQYHGQE
jgi:hypothetical protein